MAKASFERSISKKIRCQVRGRNMAAAAMLALGFLAATSAFAQVEPGKYLCVSDDDQYEEPYVFEMTIAADRLILHRAGAADAVYVIGESAEGWTAIDPTSEDIEFGMVSHRYVLFYDDLQKLTFHNEFIYRDGVSQSNTIFTPQDDMLIAYNSFTEGTVSGNVISYCQIR